MSEANWDGLDRRQADPIVKTSLMLQLEEEEGKRNVLYRDSEGYLTIGVGHLMEPSRGGRLSDRIIYLILEEDIAAKTRELYQALPWVRQLDEIRRRVLIIMTFNMGIGNAEEKTGLLGFNNTLALVEKGHYTAAAANMLKSHWATQVAGPSGTGKRAKRLAKMMETGKEVKLADVQ